MNSLKIIFDRDTWQEIFGSIQKNKVRTIITVIGVLWGIFITSPCWICQWIDNGFEREFENIAMNLCLSGHKAPVYPTMALNRLTPTIETKRCTNTAQ